MNWGHPSSASSAPSAVKKAVTTALAGGKGFDSGNLASKDVGIRGRQVADATFANVGRRPAAAGDLVGHQRNELAELGSVRVVDHRDDVIGQVGRAQTGEERLERRGAVRRGED